MATPATTAAAATPTTHPNTYHTFYLDPANDDYQGEYSEVMRVFLTTLNPQGPDSHDDLHEQVFGTAETQIQAYLLLVQELDQSPYITVLHRPIRYTPRLGAGTEPTDLGLVGDFRHGTPPQLVLWPDRDFLQTPAVTVPSPTQIDAIFAADEALELTGPFPNNSQGTDTITTYKMMYLPPKYIGIVLGRHLTPRELWDELGGAIRNETATVQADLAPLLNWIRAAVTKFNPTNYPVNRLDHPKSPAPFIASLQDHLAEVFHRDLPGWSKGPSPPSQPGTQPVVDAVNHLAAELVRGRQEEAARRVANTTKTPEQYYGAGILSLYRFTHVGAQADLPPLYAAVSNTTKKNLRTTIAEHLRSLALDTALEYYVPVVTPDLATKISGLHFSHPDTRDLTAGIQPFLTPALDGTALAEATQNVTAYDALMAGATAQLQDLAALQAAHKVRLPRTILQTGHQIKSFGLLLRALLGTQHALAQEYNRFVLMFDMRQARLETYATTFEYPAQIIRWLQLRISNWFNNQQLSPAQIPPPSLTALFDLIENEEPWKPAIPGLPNQVPAAQPSAAPPAAGDIRPPAPTTAASSRTRVANNDYDPAMQSYKDSGVNLGTARDHAKQASDPIPTNSQGTEMCLSYHVLGFCWSNCSRVQDHRKHGSAETKQLKEWCDKHYS